MQLSIFKTQKQFDILRWTILKIRVRLKRKVYKNPLIRDKCNLITRKTRLITENWTKENDKRTKEKCFWTKDNDKRTKENG